MPNNKSRRLFNVLSPFYSRLFNRQRNNYSRIFRNMSNCDLSHFSSILDVGCGSGAMASVFADIGLKTYAIDHSIGMLGVAKRRRENRDVLFLQGSAESGLSFPEDIFDIVIAAYVAHGMKKDQRLMLYGEMKRVGKHLVILYDYNDVRSIITTIAEIAEGGDYFNFVREVKQELTDYFGNLEVIQTEKRGCCYICSIG